MGYSESEISKIMAWIAEHGSECDICGEDPVGYRWGRLHLDHNDATGEIRGLLCPSCNLSIGKFDHDIARLEAAISYLRRPVAFGPECQSKMGW
jgi:hypothetical protein